jgi:UDP-4-amino-4,6-dideoxy-N-acetyl-beta-L-altrosamine N-acetyltransferase
MIVQLRPLRDDDSAQVLAWRNSPEVAAHMYTDHAISQAEHDRWLEAAQSEKDRAYWIILYDRAPVGLANIVRIDLTARRCEWAYYLGSSDTRGKGIGAATEYIVLDHVFGVRGLNKLWCEVFVENEAVWKIHEGFGFQREAHLRQHVHKGGRYIDVYGLGLLAEDWERARPNVQARLHARGYYLPELKIVSD